MPTEEVRRQLQRLVDSALAKDIQGKVLMAAAVATMAETADDDSAMPKREKLLVGDCCLCTAPWGWVACRMHTNCMMRRHTVSSWHVDG